MSSFASTGRYVRSARWLHWVMAVLILLAYVLILSRSQFERGSLPRMFVVQSHYWVGIALLVLALFRVAVRHRHKPPAIVPPLQGTLHVLATLSHVLLYAFLLAQPVLGLLAVWLEKGAVPIPLTSLAMPSPFALTPDFAGQLEDLHKLFGKLFYYLFALHLIASLWHHFVRRDNTVRRMV